MTTGLDHYVGEILDEKYRLERLLGQGGMGAVYLATHLGTERYVALKLITPQFMRNEEFVQRFKREARAAGRLRHPNVVDVTDFGFARASGEPVAYLVMEYLDGCTLGDVLSEEKRLPLEWVVDILDQVCSAVHEAHLQGVIHRDLKPENIWLEPNRLGGYRVKVLDFGIAKLGATDAPVPTDAINPEVIPIPASSRISADELEKGTLIYDSGAGIAPAAVDSEVARATDTQFKSAKTTIAGGWEGEPGDGEPNTDDGEGNAGREESNATQLFARSATTSIGLGPTDAATSIFPPPADKGAEDFDDGKTLRLDIATRRGLPSLRPTFAGGLGQTTQLTQIGAIMGTPLYMSPEQCAAKSLDARSDIYSLGVIAYQMLSGELPFAGNTASVMKGHIEAQPQHLRERVKKVPKRAARVVMSALAKDPAERPQTAAAFANALRAEADGIGTLYRRALVLYFEHFPKFFRLSLIAHIPVIVSTFLLISLELWQMNMPKGMGGMAMKVTWVSLLVLVALMQVASYFVAAAAISGMTAVIVTQQAVAPLRQMELHTAFAVLKKRWRAFLKTALRVTIRQLIGFVLFIIPGFVVSVRYMLYAPVVLMEGLEKKAALKRARELGSRSWRTVIIIVVLQFFFPLVVSAIMGKFGVTTNNSGELHVARKSQSGQIFQQLSGLVNIFIVPLASIVSALLYLKMRQLGGESLSAALDQIQDVDVEKTQWQQRMRTRLHVSSARSGGTPGSTPGSSR